MKRYIQFDILRIIAVFAVIMLHVSASRFWVSFPSYEWEVLNVYDSLSRWGVPIFVMISGALFLDSNKPFSIKKLYGKNIVRILCALVFWSVIYQLYRTNADTTLWQFVSGVIKGPVHLWFLKMLLGLYVVIPVLRLIVVDRKIELYFLIIAFLTAFIIPLFIRIIGYYDPQLNVAATKLVNTIGLDIASGYTGYFVLGHYLSTLYLKHIRKVFYCMGFLSFFSVMVLTSVISHYFNYPKVVLYDNLIPLTLFEAIAVVCFVSYNVGRVSNRFHMLIVNLSKMSFGIYLIHILIIKIADDRFGINSSVFNPVIFVPCFSIIVFVISKCIVWILSRIPVLNRYII